MSAADVHMLSGAYAIDAIEDADERHTFEAHLEACEACRVEVRSLRAAVVTLAEAVAVQPPRSLRSRVMAEIAVTQQAPQLSPRMPRASSAPAAPSRRLGVQVAAAAAAVVIAGGGLVVGGVQLLRAQQGDVQAQRVLQIVGNPTARRVAAPVAGGGTATVYVADGQAALLASGVPGLAEGRTYQLWVVRPDQRVVSAGLGPAGLGAAGQWSRLITGVRTGDKVALSVEPDGGSAQPTTKPLIVLQA
ncbi:MAG TPA: anti-sigma factor [Kineosporiaceae bacterium]